MMMMPGVPIITRDGRVLYVPALTLAELEANQEKLDRFVKHFVTSGWIHVEAETIGGALDAIGVSLARNHPEVKRSDLPALLDIRETERAIGALLGKGEVDVPPPTPRDYEEAEGPEVKEMVDRRVGELLQGRPADA